MLDLQPATFDEFLSEAKRGNVVPVVRSVLADLQMPRMDGLTLLSELGPCSQQRMAEEMGVSGTMVVQVVDALEREGLVERRRNPKDRRANALHLTRKGGTCVLTGMTSQLTRSVNIDLQDFILMNKSLAGTVFGSCNPRADITRLARLYQTGRLQLDEMITRRYRLDDINGAYRDLINGEIIRGIIDFGIA